MNGGYCLIDCTGINFSSGEAETVNGIHKKFYDAMGQNKIIFACNIIGDSDDGLYTPIPCICILDGETINVTSAVKNFTISTADLVTITA